jgi:TorA maturation chaperone TorD
MVGDRELLGFRLGYYDLLVSLLWKEPAGELVAALAHGIEERRRAARNLNPLLGEGWEEIGRFLDRVTPAPLGETVVDEYTRLFIGPGEPEVNPYESFYLTGRLLDRPLAVLRDSLKIIGIEKQEGYSEPEDSLAFELEVTRRLIQGQSSAGDPDGEIRWLNSQARFLKEHLLVWGPAVAQDLAAAKGAQLYRGVAKLLQGFLELERELFRTWGGEEVRSLDEARQRFAGRGEWKGPLFDRSPDPGAAREAPES